MERVLAICDRLFEHEQDPEDDVLHARIEELCGDDADLRVGVLAVLHQSDDFMARPLVSPRPHDPDALVGQTLGNYEIVELLGQGGMGLVYRARRTSEYAKFVAIKVLKAGTSGTSRHRRFEEERRMLARLEHEGIARLLDAGEFEDRPYLVMELVEGIPLDRYCDEVDMGIDGRLHLFLKVCSAVSYAHRSLIVHRDLKPSNILVTEDGTPKLLDFGIAKLLEDASSLTRTGEGPMTPAYASPEQVVNGGITVGSDVYSLGVVLYKLLTGIMPYSIGPTPGEIVRAICHEIPPKPSMAGGGRDFVLSSSAGLTRRLRGDLDVIIMRALEKGPADRYDSVAHFAEDIGRHREGRPILARSGAVYVTRKFIRRNRISVVASVLVALLVVGFLISSLVQASRVKRERDRAEHAASFIVGMFDVADPNVYRGKSRTVEDALDLGVDRIRSELADPELQARLLGAAGQVYVGLGRFDRAAPLLEESLTMIELSFGQDSREYAEELFQRAEMRRWNREFRDAVADYELAINSGFLEGEMLVRALCGVSEVMVSADMADAGDGVREAFELLSEPDLETLRVKRGCQEVLGIVAVHEGELDEAMRLFDDLVEQYEAEEDPRGNPGYARVLSWIGVTLNRSGRLEEAVDTLELAVGLLDDVFGKGNVYSAVGRRELSAAYLFDRRFEEAETALRTVVGDGAEFGDEHDLVGLAAHDLAAVLGFQGRFAEGLEFEKKALAIQLDIYGEEHRIVAATQCALGRLYGGLGQADVAETHFETCLAILQKTVDESDIDMANAQSSLGQFYMNQSEFHSAEPHLRSALELRSESFPDENRLIAFSMGVLGECLLELGNLEEAEELLLSAHQGSSNRRDVERSLNRLIRLFEATGDLDRAAEFMRIREEEGSGSSGAESR